MTSATRPRSVRTSSRARRPKAPPYPILTVPSDSNYGAVLTLLRQRWERGFDEMKRARGEARVKPPVSEYRVRALAKILYMAANLDGVYLEDLERMATMCHDHTGGIDWKHADTRREVEELSLVVSVLSFDPDSWLEEPTEQQQRGGPSVVGPGEGELIYAMEGASALKAPERRRAALLFRRHSRST